MNRGLLLPILVLLLVPIPGTAGPPYVVLPRIPSWLPQHDAVPIRRVYLSPRQYADLIVPPGQSPFVRMTRDEFERKMRAVSNILDAPLPFLSEARYSARFANGSLSGTAEWTVNNPSRKPGVLALDPLRIALSDVHWDGGRPAAMSRTATTGSDEKSKTIVPVDADRAELPAPPGRKLMARWSSRSASDSEPNRFLLRIPPANVARLDLELPANAMPVIRRDRALLTGPFPTDDPKWQRWTISLGGQDTCEFTLKFGHEPAVAHPGPAKSMQRWTFAEGGFEGKISFDFDPAHQRADEYRFDISNDLRVIDVAADVPIGWNVTSQTLHVTPIDPGTLPRIAITVRSPAVPFGKAWSIPAMTLQHRLPSDDMIQLNLASGIHISSFEPGDFQIVESDSTEDGGRIVKWSGTFSHSPSAQRVNPTLTFDAVPAQITVTERSTMEIHRRDLRVRSLATVTAVRGPVRELSLTVPRGYRLPDMPVVDSDPAAEVGAKPGAANEITIQLARPLSTGQSTTVSFQLVRTNEIHNGAVRFAVPAVMWRRAERTGSVTVNPSDAFEHPASFVVVYQDFPLQSEQSLKLAERVPTPERTETGPEHRPRIGVAGSTLVHAAQCRATVEPERLVVNLTGRTAADVHLQRIAIPRGMTVESVRISGQWRDRYRLVNDGIEYDSGTPGDEPFEIHGTIPLSSNGIERLNIEWDDGGAETAVQWSSTTGWLLGPTTNRRSVWIVYPGLLTGLSWLVAGLLLLPLTRTAREVPSRGAFRAFLLVAAIACSAAFFGGSIASAAILPGSVALMGMVVWVVRTKPAALAALLLVAGFPAFAAAPNAPAIPVVYLVNGTGDDAAKLFALVPRELNDRLERLLNPLPSDAVIVQADYRLEEREDDAAFEAKWSIRLTGTVPQVLAVPCSGVKVMSVQLDGQPAFPEPLPQGNGFTITLSGPGLHVLTAKLSIAIRRIADEREIRFTGPDVPEASLVFRSRASHRAISIASRKGKQTTAESAPGIADTKAELGEGNQVLVRWRMAEPAAEGPAEPATEVSVWDLGEGTATLNAGILFPKCRPDATYRIAIPPSLTVTRVSARSIDSGNPIPTDWNVDRAEPAKNAANGPARQILAVAARSADEGGVAISLVLVPDRTLTRRPELAFPRAENHPDPNAIYAVRANGVALSEIGFRGAAEIPGETAAKAASRFPELFLDSRPATKAYQRINDSQSLSLTLKPSESHAPAQHLFTWTIGQRSDLLAESKWDAPTPAYDSWELPDMLIPIVVRGTDVIDWTFANHRLGVWLRTGDESSIVRWTATMGERTERERTLPLPRSSRDQTAPRTVRIRSGNGWNVKVVPMAGVVAVAEQANTYTVASTVDSLNILVEAVEISPSATPAAVLPTEPNPATGLPVNPNPNAARSPLPAPEEAEASPSPLPAASPWRAYAAWLCLFIAVGTFAKWGSRRLIPEMVVGWGVVGWMALGPFFAAIVVIGLIHRLILTVK